MPTELRDDDAVGQALAHGLVERYRIEGRVGRGGMGVVYKAYDLRHERPVAIKVLREEVSAALGDARFHREIQVTAGLSHPNILPLLDSGDVDGHLFFVAPFVEGGSLRDVANRRGTLGFDELLPYVIEIGAALDFAHRHNIVHRDIKPDNVFVLDGHAVLADFGLARAIDAVAGLELTRSGIAIGSPDYMSPEQALGRRAVDGRADLYSFGCLIFELLTSEVPYSGPHISAVLRAYAEGAPPDVRAFRPDLPPTVGKALKRAMAKNPHDRFAAVGNFVRVLEEASTNSRSRSLPLALVAAAAIVVTGILVLIFALAF